MACAAALAASAVAVSAKIVAPSSSVLPSRAAVSCTSVALLSVRRSSHTGALGLSAKKRGSAKFNPLPIRAAASDDTTPDVSKQAEEVFNDLKAKWDGIENKTSVAIYGSGALVALWFSSTIVSTINTVPLLPKFMELVGLGYTGWFVYRYLLFKENRKELAADIEQLKSKIAGAADEISK